MRELLDKDPFSPPEKTPEPVLVIPKLVKRIGQQEIEKAFERSKAYGSPNRTKIPAYLSYSQLKAFLMGHRYKQPYRYIEYLFTEPEPEKGTGAMLLGSLVEHIVCGGLENVEEFYYVYKIKITDKIKDEAKAQGKTPIINTLLKKAIKVGEAALAETKLIALLSSPELETQKKINFTEPVTGLTLQANFDFRIGNKIMDLKTTAMFWKFEECIWSTLLYWIQAAIYTLAVPDCEEFSFFAVSTQAPYFVQEFRFDKKSIKKLQTKLIKEVLIPYMDCLENGFCFGSSTVHLPKWI